MFWPAWNKAHEARTDTRVCLFVCSSPVEEQSGGDIFLRSKAGFLFYLFFFFIQSDLITNPAAESIDALYVQIENESRDVITPGVIEKPSPRSLANGTKLVMKRWKQYQANVRCDRFRMPRFGERGGREMTERIY